MSALPFQVLFEDDHLIAINKPNEMLSVPGVEPEILKNRKPRDVEWLAAIRQAHSWSSANESLNEQCKYVLLRLSEMKSAPRNEKSFFTYMQRVSKVTDATIHRTVWDYVNSVDIQLHYVPSTNIRPERISAATFVSEYLSQKVYTIHRLDCETSGILLFAKTFEASSDLCQQFRERDVCKLYVAEVDGDIIRGLESSRCIGSSLVQAVSSSCADVAEMKSEEANGSADKSVDVTVSVGKGEDKGQISKFTISAPLMAHPTNKPLQVVDLIRGKVSKTLGFVLYSVRNSRDVEPPATTNATTDQCSKKLSRVNTSLVALMPITGRSHQLRVHMEFVGSPIIGDTLYHPKYCTYVTRDQFDGSVLQKNREDISSSQDVSAVTSSGQASSVEVIPGSRLKLHAHQIMFNHPITKERIHLTAPCSFRDISNQTICGIPNLLDHIEKE